MIVRHRSPFGTARFGITTTPRPFAFDRTVDRTFEQLAGVLAESRRRTPAIDTAWHDGSLQLTVDLPGVPAEAVSVEVRGRDLTLSARTDDLTWQRTVRLGTSLDPERVAARHVDGRLTVTVAPVASPEPRRIAVDTAPAQPAIEATESPAPTSGDAAVQGEDTAG